MVNDKFDVHARTIDWFLKDGVKNGFVVPPFQRQYSWENKQVEQLLEDVIEFSRNFKEGDEYFLGCVVSCVCDGKLSVIDGQQRTVTLLLVMRAVLEWLETRNIDRQHEAKKASAITKVSSLLWRTDPLTDAPDRAKVSITYQSYDTDASPLTDILIHGSQGMLGRNDLFVRNYKTVLGYLTAIKDPAVVFNFIYVLREHVQIMDIRTDTLDSAIRIFTTLNNRGLALEDADLLKAEIYHHFKDDQERQHKFVEGWGQIEGWCREDDAWGFPRLKERTTMQNLLYCYMIYLRSAKDKQEASNTMKSLYRFFVGDKKEKSDVSDYLFKDDLLDNLQTIMAVLQCAPAAKISQVDKEFQPPVHLPVWSENGQILRLLDILDSFPNEWAVYPVVVFYMAKCNDSDFEDASIRFLRRLVKELLCRYIDNPSVSATKSFVVRANNRILREGSADGLSYEIDRRVFKDKAQSVTNRGIVEMVLKILCYDNANQQGLICNDKGVAKIEVEHIKAKSSGAKEWVDLLGNKTLLEKRRNAKVGAKDYMYKKDLYRGSSIAMTQDLGNREQTEWTQNDASARTGEMLDRLLAILDDWGIGYRFQGE